MLNDYELLYLIHENNEEAMNFLLEKYSKTIYSKCLKYSNSNNNIDDYINEGIQAFYEAVKTYNENTKFITYLNTCLDRKLLNYKKMQDRKKHSILNNSISLEDDRLSENIFMDNRNNPELVLLNNENYIFLRKNLLKKLDYNEELVFLLKEQNFSNKEISKIIDKRIRIIYSIIDKIRIKAKCLITN